MSSAGEISSAGGISAGELLAPDQMTLASAAQALSRRLAVRARGPLESDRTFFDTFDGLLYAAGASLVHEQGRLVLIDRESGEQRSALSLSLPARPLLARELAPGALRDALTPVAEPRALLALVRVHCRLQGFDVLDDERKTVVRMTFEEPVLIPAGRAHAPLRSRLRLVAVRGYDEALAQVRGTLVDELGFAPADQLLVDEAVTAAGGVPGGRSSKLRVPLSAEQQADAAAGAVLRKLAEVIEDNLPGAITDIDSEFLHDLRVAVRRSRAVQREFRGVFPAPPLAGFRAEFRRLQQITGDSRDLDVALLEFAALSALIPVAIRPELEPLLEVLRRRRLDAREEMVRELRSERTARLLQDWGAFLEELVELPGDHRPEANRTIAELSAHRIRKVYKRMVRMGGRFDESSPPEEFHDLRKKGKELRYLLELFAAALFAPEVVRPMIKTLKSLQDVLGRHQDREVQIAMLSSLRDEVWALPGGAPALMAMGALVQRLREDEQAARNLFAGHFAAFASPEQLRLVRETFS